MKLKELYRCIACASLVAPTLVFAQQGSEPEIEEVVVTGSLIRGTPVDAALPVEVYSQDDLALSGSPSALDFAKSLSISGATTGESYYFGGAGLTGSVQYNLRGIGSDKTLSLFNGRRVTQNTSVIPSIALQRTEILKDGAAVTYGADATGGVVNFISRDSFEGIEIQSSYKAIDGSDGDWNVGIVGGFSGDVTDVVWAASWDHRSLLNADERPFTDLPYGVNPAPWSTLTNLAGWLPRGALPATQTYNPASSNGAGDWGNPVGGVISDFTQSSCEAVGGVYVNSFTCAYNYIPYYNVVSENDIYRLFGQVTTQVTDSMEFYARAAYSMVDTPAQYGSPSQPVIRGPAIHGGATYQLYVPKNNPFVQDFATRTGFINNPAWAVTQGFTPITYRAFAHGGLDTFAEDGKYSTPSKIRNKFTHLVAGFEGEFDNGITYDIATTYNQSNLYADSPDMMLYNVQEALNGFGGPNCNVPDLNPNRFGTQNPALAGSAGCSWYNPFASNFAQQPVYGLANPSYVPGAENPDELIEWMFNPRATRDVNWNLTFDAVFSGETPLELPGGIVGWAAGAQFRTTENQEIVTDPLYNGSRPCQNPATDGQVPRDPSDPLYNGCTPDEPGPFQFFSTNPADFSTQDQTSVFGELSLPVLDNVFLSAAARYEEFSGGLDSTVYKVSGQWNITDNMSVRGSYGTNYQAPGADIIPGEFASGTASYTVAGGNWRGAQTVTRSDIVPEEATVWSSGFIWQSEGFTAGSDFRFIIDYFNIETENELGLLASVNQIASSVFSISPTGSGAVPTNGSALADCSHPLVGRVTFNGQCVQGVTTAADFSEIRTDFGNGPGQLTAGFDIQTTYGFPAFSGDVTLSATATKINKFQYTETTLDGFQIEPGADRLGFLNFATIANAVSEWRGNLTANYAQGDHNFRLQALYIKGVKDDRYFNADGTRVGDAALTPSGRQIGSTDPYGPSLYGVFGEDWVSVDFHYTLDLLDWDATLSASIENIADEMPPASRQELGYDPRIGNPLGRTFQVGVTKRF
ncbi:TonB-dependent receptor domain-containing protein [Pseudohongiella sp. O18]|uniref:TonB-dependent receptor domain-containing protein n=1 Tax=Pseudohongiella sp. O18 TaxID=2904248 RepID=UPI001F4494A0|nr:TonB-dependent receptor [Pseudohongiella sp. O18]